jgi:hypothetical protein
VKICCVIPGIQGPSLNNPKSYTNDLERRKGSRINSIDE